MPERPHAEIAGAGFAGLVAAIALSDRGWTVRVHERASELRALGAGIFVWDNGLRVLREIGAYATVVDRAHEALVYEDRHENCPTSCMTFDRHAGTRMLTMTRQHLYAAILGAARQRDIEILTNSQAASATTDGRLQLTSGAEHRADLIIGADGVGSQVRDSLGLRTERSTGAHGIIRVLVPRSRKELGDDDRDKVIDFWNIRQGSLRILYVPCSNDELYMAMMSPLEHREAAAIPPRQDVWQSAFPQLATAIAEATSVGRYDPYETSKLRQWSAGRVAIIGDAAHAMVPSLGQGAGLAMTNALALAVQLEDTENVEEALTRWETAERPLTEYTQDQSAKVALERVHKRECIWTPATLRAARHIPTGTSAEPV